MTTEDLHLAALAAGSAARCESATEAALLKLQYAVRNEMTVRGNLSARMECRVRVDCGDGTLATVRALVAIEGLGDGIEPPAVGCRACAEGVVEFTEHDMVRARFCEASDADLMTRARFRSACPECGAQAEIEYDSGEWEVVPGMGAGDASA